MLGWLLWLGACLLGARRCSLLLCWWGPVDTRMLRARGGRRLSHVVSSGNRRVESDSATGWRREANAVPARSRTNVLRASRACAWLDAYSRRRPRPRGFSSSSTVSVLARPRFLVVAPAPLRPRNTGSPSLVNGDDPRWPPPLVRRLAGPLAVALADPPRDLRPPRRFGGSGGGGASSDASSCLRTASSQPSSSSPCARA